MEQACRCHTRACVFRLGFVQLKPDCKDYWTCSSCFGRCPAREKRGSNDGALSVKFLQPLKLVSLRTTHGMLRFRNLRHRIEGNGWWMMPQDLRQYGCYSSKARYMVCNLRITSRFFFLGLQKTGFFPTSPWPAKSHIATAVPGPASRKPELRKWAQL